MGSITLAAQWYGIAVADGNGNFHPGDLALRSVAEAPAIFDGFFAKLEGSSSGPSGIS